MFTKALRIRAGSDPNLRLASRVEQPQGTPLDSRDLSDDPKTAAACDMNDDVERAQHVSTDGVRRNVTGARQQQLKAIDRSCRRTRMRGRERTLVTRGQRVEQCGSLTRRSDFADDDPIRAHP